MEIEGVNTTHHDLFPFSALRVLGSLQTFFGALCVLLGVADLALLIFSYNDLLAAHSTTPAQKAEFKQLESMTVASAPIWCGTWFMVTGSLGTCISRTRSHSLKFLKIAFLVLSILCSAFFGPTCTVLSGMIAVMRHTMDHTDLMWLMSTASAFLGLCETGIAIISASVCCCCAPLSMAKVHILFADSEPPNPPLLQPPSRRSRPKAPQARREPEQAEERVVALPPLRQPPRPRHVPVMKEAVVQTDQPFPPPLKRQVSLLPLPPPTLPLASPPLPRQKPRDADPRYPVLQRPTQQRRVEFIDEERRESPVSQMSFGYDQLRKWALPHK